MTVETEFKLCFSAGVQSNPAVPAVTLMYDNDMVRFTAIWTTCLHEWRSVRSPTWLSQEWWRFCSASSGSPAQPSVAMKQSSKMGHILRCTARRVTTYELEETLYIVFDNRTIFCLKILGKIECKFYEMNTAFPIPTEETQMQENKFKNTVRLGRCKEYKVQYQ